MRAILAQKKEMTHIFDKKGNQTAVTLLFCGGNVVTQLKNDEKDGYEAVQIGFGHAKKLSKPQAGHLIKAKKPVKNLREVESENGKTYQIGDEINAGIFAEGDLVKVQGVSKGKGFAGTIKRHNFNTGPKTHGSHNYRAPGSIGAGYPQHVLKGQKLPGRMGATKVTTKNLEVVKVIPEENLILVAGAVPGPKKGIVLVTAPDAKKAEKTEE